MLVGGKTGNDGYHGGTVASMGLDKAKKAEDHVQIGDPYTQQKMMPAIIMFRDGSCTRANNDFGAGGFISAFGEMAAPKKLSMGKLYWRPHSQFRSGASQMRRVAVQNHCHWRKPGTICFYRDSGKTPEFVEICELFELEWTIVGVCTGNGRLQIVYDENVHEYTKDIPLSGQILFDRPYEIFENCPLEQVEIIEPPAKKLEVEFPGNYL